MCKLSIIVPVYDVEPFLRRCVESILSQSFEDFEVILVDDGSPDRCGFIIDDYSKKDERVIPIHQQNKGVSEARNVGLNVARGKYIGFVDPDDWIEPEMYSVLFNSIELFNCDIASCSWVDNDDLGNERIYSSGLSSQVMTGEEYMKHLFDMPPTISGSACSKVFKKSIIQSDFSKQYFINEDNLFVAKCCANCNKAVYINNPLYHVYLRNNSATRKIPGKVAYGLPARRDIIEIAKSVSDECGMLAEKVFLDQCIVYTGSTVDEKFRNYSSFVFYNYMHHNLLSVINNRTIAFKQKMLYLYRYLKIVNTIMHTK